jgi:urease accessory protein
MAWMPGMTMGDGLASGAPRSLAVSTLHAHFAGGPRAHLARVHESGALRLRLPRRAAPLEGVILNTGGGVLGGDRMDLSFDLARGASAVLTTVAAEKIYRGEDEPAILITKLVLAENSRLDWLPQETILFDQSRLRRALQIDMAGDASLLAAEMLVFGRLAMGETAITGSFRDSWRLRRDGRLIFADETRLEGDIAAILDRPALGGGARAAALLLYAAPDAEQRLDDLRKALAPFPEVESGASAFNGILVARFLARSPDRLRAVMIGALAVLREATLPRVWQSSF